MFVLKDEYRFFYDRLGVQASGPTVCLTHSLTADSGMWAEQVPALLQAGYQVVRIDMRGHGASDAVSGDCTMDDLADDVAHVLKSIGCGDVHFIGLSIGGMLGQSLALRYPELVRSLMLCDTLPASIPAADPTWIERKREVSSAKSTSPLAESTMSRWFTSEFKKKNPDRYREIHTSILATHMQGFLGCASAVQSFDFTALLPTIRMPALVVCGALDMGTPPAENQRLAELIPGAQYKEIPNCQHLPNVEQPDIFNQIMLEWLASVKGPATSTRTNQNG